MAATVHVRTAVEHGTTFFAQEVSPAGGLASFLGSMLDGHLVRPGTVVRDRQEVDREADLAEELDVVLDDGGYGLRRAGAYCHTQLGLGPGCESETA